MSKTMQTTSRRQRAAAHLGAFILIALPIVLAAPMAAAQSVLFDNSYFGSDQPNDMMDRVVRPVMLDTYLPKDTTGWTVNQIACSQTALRNAIMNAAPRTVVYFPPNCTITITSGNGVFFNIRSSQDSLVVRGNADGRTRIVVDMASSPPPEGWDHSMFQIGDSTNTGSITSWTWDGGYAKGGQVLSSNQAINFVHPGDIVRLTIDQWADVSADFASNYFVLCAQWADGTRVGTDCSGVTRNNQIKIDRELPFDMTGSSYQFGTLTGHRITHVERLGGNVIDRVTNHVPMHIGIEDLTIQHMDPMGLDAFDSMIELRTCMECWMSGIKATAWGNSWLGTGASGYSAVSRFLVYGSDFEGPLWRLRCVADVVGVSNSTPAEVTLQTNGACRSWCTGLEPGFRFPDDFPDPGLRGKITRCSCSEGNAECDPSDNRVTIALTDAATSQPVNGSGLDNTPGGWGVQINNYGIAGLYFSGPTSHTQVVNSSFKNTRVGFIQSTGAYESVAFGNYYTTDSEHHASRCLFVHGSGGSGTLWERNDCDMGYTPYASAAQGHGIGPYMTMLYNRGRDRGPKTNAFPDQCPGGGICTERTGQDGRSNDDNNFIGNFVKWITWGGERNSSYPLDLCDNDGSRGGGPDCTLGGSQDPFLQYGMWWLRNVVWGETLGADDFDAGPNPTSHYPDAFEGDMIDTRPAAWASTNWPTTLAYDRQIEADASWTAPDWWCQESGPFHNGMGAPADNLNGGNPNYSKLPAQIRMEGGTCTPVNSNRPVPPVVQ
ncbi:MAG: hypothetical protein QF570_00290 [Myxococcota bacterium]|jgi:hypothetical protein|nr:hypothetical protein [Myxococcota bacterium]